MHVLTARRWTIAVLTVTWGLAGILPASSARSNSPADTGSAEGLKPYRLRCEYLVDPLGIDEPAPRLSWALASDARGQKQSGYRILAALTPEGLSADNGDLWDAGRVSSGETTQIPYGGSPPHTGQRVWWKVRSWNQDGKPGPWSRPACWEMGILDPQEWSATWIGQDDDPKHDKPLPLLRKAFSLSGELRRARAYVCGVGYFELYVNGERIGDARLAPSYTRYDKRLLYETYDVTDALREGGNAVGVMLGNGWFNVATQAAWDFDKAPWRASPRLLCELRLEYADGHTETVASDGTWKTAPGPITFSSIYGGESYDSRLEQHGWSTFDFDDSQWKAAEVLAAPKGKLAPRTMPPIRFMQSLEPARVTRISDNVRVYDFGQNMSGCVKLSATGPAGSEVRMVYGELLRDNGQVNQDNIAVHVWARGPSQQFQTDTYTLCGKGREDWRARFTYHGFRYVEVTADPEVLENLELTAQVMHTDLPPVGHFECSNELLNQIWNNTCWSYLSNWQGIPTDCPHREKNGWTGDAHVACEFGLLNFDGAAAYTKWMQDLQDEQQPDGRLPGIVPTGGWGYAWGNGPAWDSAYLLIPDYLRLYCGDHRVLDRQYEGHRRYVDYLEKASNNLIVGLGLGDWLPWKTETPVELTSTGYFYRDTQIVAQTAQRLGDTEAALHYGQLADDIRDAFDKQFWDNGYKPPTQTALSCALFQGPVEPERRAAVVDRLVEEVAKTDYHIDTGLLGSKYLLTALSDNGHAEIAYRIASQETQPGWGWWIKQGATTLWEHWTTAGSHNHIMFGDVAAWFTKALAGLRPDPATVGFANVIVDPHPVEGLQWARATHDSLRGPIGVSWRQDPQQFSIEIEIPANVTATVHLPTDNREDVTEGDKPIDGVAGVATVGVEDGRLKLQIGSGRYRFVVSREPVDDTAKPDPTNSQ